MAVVKKRKKKKKKTDKNKKRRGEREREREKKKNDCKNFILVATVDRLKHGISRHKKLRFLFFPFFFLFFLYSGFPISLRM